jgi:hypothetical protein
MAWHGRGERLSQGRELSVHLDAFGWGRLSEEARRQGIGESELAAHAILYYLADLDSGRLSARALPDDDQERSLRDLGEGDIGSLADAETQGRR